MDMSIAKISFVHSTRFPRFRQRSSDVGRHPSKSDVARARQRGAILSI